MSTSADPFARAIAIPAHDGEHATRRSCRRSRRPRSSPSLLCRDGRNLSRPEGAADLYPRAQPDGSPFEEKMAALECGEDAIGFASGMAAISSAVLAFVEPGDRIVAWSTSILMRIVSFGPTSNA